MLRDGLASVWSAPLKPQQRFYITTYHLLRKCQHKLALAPASAKYLKWLDRTVRSALRTWLRGGLGVPPHDHVVPLMRAKRLSRLGTSPDPVIAAMQCWIHLTTLNGSEMTSSCDLKVTLAKMLHRTVDGRGLALSSQVPECHCWVNLVCSGGAPNTAISYIAAIRV